MGMNNLVTGVKDLDTGVKDLIERILNRDARFKL